MLDWIGSNRIFLILSMVLITSVVLAIRVGRNMQEAISPEPVEISLLDPLNPLSALDLEAGEEVQLNFSDERTILFVLRRQDLSRQETLSFWNEVNDAAGPGTRVCGLLALPTDLGPLPEKPHFRLLRSTRVDQLLENGISGTPTTIALRQGGTLSGFWIGHPNAEKRVKIIKNLELWGFLRPVEHPKKEAGA